MTSNTNLVQLFIIVVIRYLEGQAAVLWSAQSGPNSLNLGLKTKLSPPVVTDNDVSTEVVYRWFYFIKMINKYWNPMSKPFWHIMGLCICPVTSSVCSHSRTSEIKLFWHVIMQKIESSSHFFANIDDNLSSFFILYKTVTVKKYIIFKNQAALNQSQRVSWEIISNLKHVDSMYSLKRILFL